MAQGLKSTTSTHFEATYEAPWGGVASNMAQFDISPAQFVVGDGISIRNGILCYSNITSQNSKFALKLLTPTNIPPAQTGGGTVSGSYETVELLNAQYIGVTNQGGNVYATGVIFTIPDTSIFPVDTHFDISDRSPAGEGVANFTGGYNPNVIIDSQNIQCNGRFIIRTNGDSQDLEFGGGPATLTYFNASGGGGTPAPPQNWPDSYICLIFNAGNYLCAVDQQGFSYIAALQEDGTIEFQLDQTAENAPTPNFGIPTAVKVVNGVAYISVYGTNTLYAYTPTDSYLVATNYCAGQIIDIFDEYLIQLNTNSAVDGVQLSRINWSAPDEFGVWDASVDRTAGFQSLTSSEDYISGFVATDNVGYIFRKEGVTQITATGVAIQPFSFTTYWNSVAGQGLIFPGTLIQYGRQIFLTTDSNVYQFSNGGFEPIGETAKAAIFSSFNIEPALNAYPNNLLSGGFSIYPFNDKIPGAEYIFIAASNAVGGNIVFWLYSIWNKAWTSITKASASLLQEYVPTATNVVVNFIKTSAVFLDYQITPYSLNVPNLPIDIIYINFTYSTSAGSFTQTYIYYNLVNTSTSDITSITIPPASLSLLFKQEQVKIGRQVNVRRVLIFACGSGVLDVQVNDELFTSVELDGTGIYKVYYADGITTQELPQVSVTSINFNGRIAKVQMIGSYAEGEHD